MQPIFIRATTLSDAWHQALFTTLDQGTARTVDTGSFKGGKRLECDHMTIQITMPWIEPLLPKVNPALNIPDPVDADYLDYYLPYLMTEGITDNEEYTYGERIAPQVDEVIKIYKDGYTNNQLILQVGKPNDLILLDPPCLRHIDTCVRDNTLHFFPYFRSWDLWGGFPANLGGIELMKQYMASQIGVNNGEIICSSKSLHLYDYVWESAKILRGKD